MNDRPTPEQIERYVLDQSAKQCLEPGVLQAVHEHGYVIVHPDDVPIVVSGYEEPRRITNWLDGWNDCRARIFSERSET